MHFAHKLHSTTNIRKTFLPECSVCKIFTSRNISLQSFFNEAKINKTTALCHTYAIKPSSLSDTVHTKHSSEERHTPVTLIGFSVINYTLCSIHCSRQSKHHKPLWSQRDWMHYCIVSNEFVTCKRRGEGNSISILKYSVYWKQSWFQLNLNIAFEINQINNISGTTFYTPSLPIRWDFMS